MHLLLQYRTSLETNIIRKHNLESDNTNWTPRLKKYLRGQELSMVQSGHKDVSFLLLWLMLLYLLFVCWLVCLLFIFCFLYFLSSFCSFFFFSFISFDDSSANIPSFVRKSQGMQYLQCMYSTTKTKFDELAHDWQSFTWCYKNVKHGRLKCMCFSTSNTVYAPCKVTLKSAMECLKLFFPVVISLTPYPCSPMRSNCRHRVE